MNAPALEASTLIARDGASVHQFPVLPITVDETTDESRPHTWKEWLKAKGMRRLEELDMVRAKDEPTRPPGFFFNYSTALFYLTVLGFIAGGFWFAYEKAEQAGYERGKQEKEMEQLRQKLAAVEVKTTQNGDMIRMAVNPTEEEKK